MLVSSSKGDPGTAILSFPDMRCREACSTGVGSRQWAVSPWAPAHQWGWTAGVMGRVDGTTSRRPLGYVKEFIFYVEYKGEQETVKVR